MASKRNFRRKSCRGKAAHANQVGAEIAIRVMVRKGKALPRELHSYQCAFCGSWHVGHPKPKGTGRKHRGDFVGRSRCGL